MKIYADSQIQTYVSILSPSIKYVEIINHIFAVILIWVSANLRQNLLSMFAKIIQLVKKILFFINFKKLNKFSKYLETFTNSTNGDCRCLSGYYEIPINYLEEVFCKKCHNTC